jgi:multidrug resistance protein
MCFIGGRWSLLLLMKKPSLLVIFLTVFIDLIGFGMVLPLLPIYSQHFGANGLMIGVIMASFSCMQLLFSPFWGRLSDRIGRRPVLLCSTAGAAVSYACFAIGSAYPGAVGLWTLLISRVVAGICGANITVAQAYIADITPPEQRSKRMGLIGMAFGLGFIFGPAFGALAHRWFGPTGPGWSATVFCLANLGLAYFILTESRVPGTSASAGMARGRTMPWGRALALPRVGLLIAVFFLATFCFACFETTLGLLMGRTFKLDPAKGEDARVIGYLFAYCGVLGAVVQGGAIGRLVRAWGEARLIAASLVLVSVSLAALPFLSSWGWLLTALGILSIGSSLTRPPVFGMISMLTPADEQGAVIGVAQSAGSLARIVGPIFSAVLFDVRPTVPYLACGAISLLAGCLAWWYLAEPGTRSESK